MDKGKRKMTPEEYEAERRSKKNASKPPQEEQIRLQPATPYMDKGKKKMTPEDYEAERLSKKNASKPPPEERIRLQPATPAALTPRILPQAPASKPPQEERIRLQPATPAALTPRFLPQAPPSLAASVVSLPEIPMPMEALVEEALVEEPLDEVVTTQRVEVSRNFQPVLTKRKIAQRARRQREQGATNIPDNTPPPSKQSLAQRNRRERERIASFTPILNTPSVNPLRLFSTEPSPLQSQRRSPHIATVSNNTSSSSIPQSFSPLNPIRLFSTESSPLQSQRRSPRIARISNSASSSIPQSFSLVNPIRLFSTESSPLQSQRRSPSIATLSNNTSSYIPQSLHRGIERNIVEDSEDHRPSEHQNYGSHDEDMFDMLIPDHNYEILPNKFRHTLGSMDVECPFCKALHFIEERLSNSSKSRPRFGMCCLQGKIKLPPLKMLPPEMQELFDGDDALSISLRNNFREYNNAFAFTSLGVQLDERIFDGQGPRPFVIHGELKHRSGPLMPGQGFEASYSQLYVYDPADALNVRQNRNPKLRQDVLKIIQEVMLKYNRFSKDFRHAYEVLSAANADNEGDLDIPASLHYSSKRDKRRYNLPTADEVAIIIPGDGTKVTCDRDIRLHLRGGNQGFVQINECHPAYLPLHYVLMFPYGELGWTPELRRWDQRRRMSIENERLTQLDFYSYLLFSRRGEYSPIFKCKKLTQQFWVDAWAATEQNKLRYLSNDQVKIRSELYQDIIDVDPECVTPEQIGKRVILPSSHRGSPRHMFEIYQDSMAITRYNRHPDIFLTMTANPRWPEVLSQLDPGEDPTDHPEIVSRVFHLKMIALVKVVRERGIFGQVVAHVFTIEF